MSGKSLFYPKVQESFISAGYEYYDGDEYIKGKTRQHRRKPDYVAIRGKEIIIGEIKSPNEPPTEGSWRQMQPNDSHEFALVRQEVREREKDRMVIPEVGGHEIIIRGQIPNYVSNLGVTYDLPVRVFEGIFKGGYSVPFEQAGNVEVALKNCGKNNIKTIAKSRHSATFIFDL